MRTYFSIISIATKPVLGEKIGVGLLCVSDEHVYYHFSREKFNVISSLLPKEVKTLAIQSLKNIQSTITTANQENNLLIEQGRPQEISESYINYLHRYNNNLIQFTQAEKIDMVLDELSFQKLFQKYIYSNEKFEISKHLKKVSMVDQFRNTFKPRVKEFVNLDFKVSDLQIKELISPITVDMFGKNGAIVTGQTIDFSRDKNWLSHDINAYMYLALSTEMNDKDAKCFLLGSEPEKKLTYNHDIWNNARKAKNIDFVPFDESERIIQYLKDKGVKPVC